MPFMRGSFFKLRADGKGHVQKVDAAARKLFYEAVAVFLSEVEIHVPTYTGMARGSLLPLARYLNARGVSKPVIININPKSTQLALSLMRRGQTIAAGEQRGEFEIKTQNGVFTIRFGPKVVHYKYNDIQPSSLPGVKSAPWQSFQKGKEKANEFIKANKGRIPRLKLNTLKVSVGTSRGHLDG